MEKALERRSYYAPELISYGRLTSLTGALACTGGNDKIGGEPDEATAFIPDLDGDPVCDK